MATFTFDDFEFDDVRYELSRQGTPLRVDTQVLELLAYLLRNPARLVTKEELIAEVWQGRALGDNVISVCVAKLRKALGGAANRCITNVYGRGYRFLRPVQLMAAPAPSTPAPVSISTAPPPDTVDGEPFVGRSVALGRLQAALGRARTGRGGVCALLGEAGIGKTRSAEVLEAQAVAAGFCVSWGRCHVFGDAPPLWPWLQVVRSCEAQLTAELVAQPFQALMRAPEMDADPDAEEGESARGGESWARPEQGAWHKTLSWMSAVTARMSATQPWLIVLEDVQWADAATLALLAHVVSQAAQLRVLIVLTARDTELPQDPRCKRALDYVLGHRDCERIELTRLRESDVQAYIKHRFGVVDGALQQAVFAKSEGNPFFMVELLRPWVDGPRPAVSELTLSGYALDIIRQALRRLESSAVEVLSAAAVVGRSFDLGMLSAVTHRSGESLIEILEEAMSSNVIVAERESQTRFVFGHDLIRHVLYEDLPSLTRVRLHQRVAEALAARESTLGAIASAELAHHLLSALPSGDMMHAIQTARGAAWAATRVGAYADACAFLRRALEALRLRPETDPRLACTLLFDLARCERGAGEPDFAKHFEEAVQLARANGYSDVLFSAGQSMSQGPGTVAMPGADAVLEAALAAIPKTDHRRRAIMLSHLSWTVPYCRDAKRVEALLAEADTLAEQSTTSAKRAVLRARLYFAGGPEEHERVLELAAQLDRMGTDRDPMKRALRSLEPLLARIVSLVQRGEFKAAQGALDGFGAAAKELHHAELIWHYERMCVVMRMNTGDFEYARRRLTELTREAERLQLHARKALEAIDWGELYRQTTDVKPFAAQFARGLLADPGDPPGAQAGKLRMLVQFGMIDEARAGLAALDPAQLHALPKTRDYLVLLSSVALAAAATNSRTHAEVSYELMRPYPNVCVAGLSIHCHGVGSHFLAILAGVLGDRGRALEHFDHAIARQERLGLLPQLARSRYDLGALLIESSDRRERDRGRAVLEQVREASAKLGLGPLRAAADQLIGGRGETSPRA